MTPTVDAPEMCVCCTCGFKWQHGRDGSHSCSRYLSISLKETQDKLTAAESAQPEAGAWIEGVPPKPWCNEWFIAQTTFNDRVVLTALPEEYAYDFKTADDTYIKADKIVRWMQFPDSKYTAPPAATIRRQAIEREGVVEYVFTVFGEGIADVTLCYGRNGVRKAYVDGVCGDDDAAHKDEIDAFMEKFDDADNWGCGKFEEELYCGHITVIKPDNFHDHALAAHPAESGKETPERAAKITAAFNRTYDENARRRGQYDKEDKL